MVTKAEAKLVLKIILAIAIGVVVVFVLFGLLILALMRFLDPMAV